MAARPDRQTEQHQNAFLDHLAEQLQALLTRIHQQCRHGWDLNVIMRLHVQVAALASACQRHGQPGIGEQLLAIDTALSPALVRMRLPDGGSTALIVALADHLRTLASQLRRNPSPDRPGSVVALRPPAQPQAATIRVLLASMRAPLAREIAASLAAAGMQVRVLSEPLAALEELSRHEPHCVLVDRHSYLYEGSELADMIHERPDFADLPVLLLGDDCDAGQGDVLPANLHGTQWADAIRKHAEPTVGDPTRAALDAGRSQTRRAWLLDRLEAAIDHGNGRAGGLLDLSIEHIDELKERNSSASVAAIHNQLARLLASVLDNGDMLAASGDGFLLLCRTRDHDHLRGLADELCHAVDGERFGPSALAIRVQVGGCDINGKLDTTDAMLSAALLARRAAPGGGVAWHQPERDRLTAMQIETALHTGRLHLVFQAIVDLGRSPTPHYQALLRLRDDDGYVHTAAELFAVAGGGRLAPALDCQALGHALHMLSRYDERRHPLRLFVNQTCDSLRQRRFAAWLGARLEANRVLGERLVLTMRRDDVSRCSRDIITIVQQIKALGVGLCLSDVDRGEESARLLDSLPLDYIKLAPALSARPGASVPIAHARNIRVISPQIEDPNVIRALRKTGVDYVQGHALAHPARSLNYRFDAATAVATATAS